MARSIRSGGRTLGAVVGVAFDIWIRSLVRRSRNKVPCLVLLGLTFVVPAEGRTRARSLSQVLGAIQSQEGRTVLSEELLSLHSDLRLLHTQYDSVMTQNRVLSESVRAFASSGATTVIRSF